jgi:hypothetical protein
MGYDGDEIGQQIELLLIESGGRFIQTDER